MIIVVLYFKIYVLRIYLFMVIWNIDYLKVNEFKPFFLKLKMEKEYGFVIICGESRKSESSIEDEMIKNFPGDG